MDVLLSKKILTIGPAYRRQRGGMGEVLKGYSTYFSPFHFICSHRAINKALLIFYSVYKLVYLHIFLLGHPAIEVVHIHGASRGSFYRKYLHFLVVKFVFRKKVIYHIHSGEFSIFYRNASPVTKRMIKHFVEKSDVLICLSRAWESFFVEQFNCKKVIVLPNMIAKVGSANLHEPSVAVKFLFLGKIREKKGVFDLLEVVKKLSVSHKNLFEVWIGGDGEGFEELRARICANNLNQNIKLLGWISGDRKNEILAKANVLVLPSYFEGFPISVLEAMSFGMPVIASRVGGIPDVIHEDVNGFLISPGDTSSLCSKMEFFILNRNEIAKFGQKSLELVEEFYSEAIIPRLIGIYQSLLNQKPASS